VGGKLGPCAFGAGKSALRWIFVALAAAFLEGRREMGTFVPSGKDIDRKWFVMDASGKTLGRLATKAADVLSGKLNPQYVPYIDVGDHVIVINAEKVRLTGLKARRSSIAATPAFPAGCARSRSRAC
jgi:ribosomal protein L13